MGSAITSGVSISGTSISATTRGGREYRWNARVLGGTKGGWEGRREMEV